LFDKRELRVRIEGRDLNACAVEDHAFAGARAVFAAPHSRTLELLLFIGSFRMICSLMTALDVEAEPPFGPKILDSVSSSHR
jgi:hypothetical protein